MKKLSTLIGVWGLSQASLWIWAPMVVRWQAENTLQRFGAEQSVGVLVQEFQATMRYVYVEAAVVGALMLLASCLLLLRKYVGWRLWICALALSVVATVVQLVIAGASFGGVVKALVLAGFAYFTIRAYQRGLLERWFTVVISE